MSTPSEHSAAHGSRHERIAARSVRSSTHRVDNSAVPAGARPRARCSATSTKPAALVRINPLCLWSIGTPPIADFDQQEDRAEESKAGHQPSLSDDAPDAKRHPKEDEGKATHQQANSVRASVTISSPAPIASDDGQIRRRCNHQKEQRNCGDQGGLPPDVPRSTPANGGSAQPEMRGQT